MGTIGHIDDNYDEIEKSIQEEYDGEYLDLCNELKETQRLRKDNWYSHKHKLEWFKNKCEEIGICHNTLFITGFIKNVRY